MSSIQNTTAPAEQPNQTGGDVHNPNEVVFVILSIFAVLLVTYTYLLAHQIQTRRQLFSLLAQPPSPIKPPFELAATEAQPPPDKISTKFPSPGDLERGRAPPAPSGFDRVTIAGTTGLFQSRNRARNLFPGRRQADVERGAVPTMIAEDADWSDHAGSFSADDELDIHRQRSPSFRSSSVSSSAMGATLSTPPQLAVDEGDFDPHTPLRNRAVSPPASLWASSVSSSVLEGADEDVNPRSPLHGGGVSLPPPARSVSVSSAVGANLSAPPQLPSFHPADDEDAAPGSPPPAPAAAADEHAPRRTRRSFREAWAQRTGPSRMAFQGITAPQWEGPARVRIESPEVSPRTSVVEGAEAVVSGPAPVRAEPVRTPLIRSAPVRVASAIPVPVSSSANARPSRRTRAGNARPGNFTRSGLPRPTSTRADPTSDPARSTPVSPNAPQSAATRPDAPRSNAPRSAATRSTATRLNAPRSATTTTSPNAPRSAATQSVTTQSAPTPSGPTTSSLALTNTNVSPYLPSATLQSSSAPPSPPIFSPAPTLFSPAPSVSSLSPTTPPLLLPLTPGTPPSEFVRITDAANHHGPISPLSSGYSDLETFSVSSFSDEGEEEDGDDSDEEEEDGGGSDVLAEAVAVGGEAALLTGAVGE